MKSHCFRHLLQLIVSIVNPLVTETSIVFCGQYVYQIPIPYSLQKGGHIEHLCLWLILIGRA